MKRFGFRTRLILAFTALMFGSMLAVGLLISTNVAKQIDGLVFSDLKHRLDSVQTLVEVMYQDSLARQKVFSERLAPEVLAKSKVLMHDSQERQVENQITHDKELVAVPTYLYDGHDAASSKLVEQLAADTASQITFFVMIPQGLLRVATSIKRADGTAATGTYIPKSSDVYESVAHGKSYFGRTEVLGSPFIGAYIPLTENGKTVGSFFIGSPETSIAQVKENMRKQKILETGYFFILDSKGTMILHPKHEGENMLEVADADRHYINKDIIERKSGSMVYRWIDQETKKITTKMAMFEYLPAFDWYLVATVNKAEADAAVIRLNYSVAWLVLCVLIVSIGVIWWVAGKFSRILHVVVDRLKENSKAITSQSREVAETATHLMTASTAQASAIEETSATLEEVNSSVARNVQATQTSTQIAEASRAAAATGQQVTQRLVEAVSQVAEGNNKAHEQVVESFNKIEQITSLVKQIEEKAQVINSIVFQTKLLSFNASVEAARAGEHGKGFAVVAEEVGQLANLTGQAAQEITSTLASSVAQVSSIIETSHKQVNHAFDASTELVRTSLDVAKEASHSIEEINENVERSSDTVKGIFETSEQQSTAVREISKAVAMIDHATHQNSQMAQSSARLAQDLKKDSEILEETTLILEDLMNGKAA